jgi:hypothetical protein
MKSLSTHLIIILFLTTSALSFAMDSPNYLEICKKIDKKNAKKLIQHTYAQNPAREIKAIQDKLENMQKKLLFKEEDAVLRMRKKYKISDEVWQARRAPSLVLINHQKNNRSVGMPNAIRDPKMPPHLSHMLKSNLEKEGINPKRYNFLMDETKMFSHPPSFEGNLIKLENGSLSFVTTTTEPGTIQLALAALPLLSLKGQEGMCFSVVKWCTCEVNITSDVAIIDNMNNFNDLFAKKLHINITNTDMSFNHWLMQTLSIVKHAIQNKYVAEILKIYHQEIGSTMPFEALEIEQYRFLSKINRYHQAIDWLKKYVLEEADEPTAIGK